VLGLVLEGGIGFADAIKVKCKILFCHKWIKTLWFSTLAGTDFTASEACEEALWASSHALHTF